MTGLRLYRLALGLGVVLLGILFVGYGYENTWQLWNIPTMSPCFADLRTITHGVRSRAMGYDPLVENPADPWGRTMNYPRIWEILWQLGVNEHHTVYLGIVVNLLFLIALYVFPPRTLETVTAAILLPLIFSPAVLLGAERGNTDLLIFFLMTVVLLLLRRGSSLADAIALATLLFAFVLKLFPIFGLPVLLRERKPVFIRLSLLALLVAGVYLAAIYDDLVLIRQGAPKGTQLSYGINVLWMRVAKSHASWALAFRVLAYTGVCGAGGLALLGLFDSAGREGTPDMEAQTRLDAFRIGSGIYLGTFLLGNNWDYRLVFLLFTVPQLMSWARSHTGHPAWMAKMAIIGTFVSVWHLVIKRFLNPLAGETLTFALDEGANWVVFFCLAFLLSYSAPEWIKSGMSYARRNRGARSNRRSQCAIIRGL